MYLKVRGSVARSRWDRTVPVAKLILTDDEMVIKGPFTDEKLPLDGRLGFRIDRSRNPLFWRTIVWFDDGRSENLGFIPFRTSLLIKGLRAAGIDEREP